MAVATRILVEATPRTGGGAAVTVRLAGGGGERPYFVGGQHWRAGIAELPRSVRSLDFKGDALGGGGVAEASEVRWAPATHAALADIANLVWADAPITLRIGPESDALPPVATTGLVLETAVDDGQLRIALADATADLKRPLLVDRFAGTGGIEGPAEWKDRIRSRAWGPCFNVPGQVIDKASNIVCFGDPARAWQAFDQIRDRGVAADASDLVQLGWQGSPAATFAALKAAATPEGGGVLCPSIACVRWWTVPGALHADIRGETAGGYVDTAAEIAAQIVAARSNLVVTGLAAAAAARPGPFGWRVDADGVTAAAVLSELLAGVSLSWIVAGGQVAFRPWDWSAPVRQARSEAVSRRETVKPVGARRIGYRRNQAPMARGDIAAVVFARDVAYEDGTPIEALKPAEGGADVTGNNSSADTEKVGGRPSTTVLGEIDAAKARVEALDTQIIPGIEDALGAADGRITAARTRADAAFTAAGDVANRATSLEVSRGVLLKNLPIDYEMDRDKVPGDFWAPNADGTGTLDSRVFKTMAWYGDSNLVWPADVGGATIFSRNIIPVDPRRRYRISTRIGAYNTGGTGNVSKMYVGFVGLDANGNVVDHTGAGTYRYAAVAGVSVVDGQQIENSAIVTGEGNDSFVKFPPGTRQIRLVALLNERGAAGIVSYIDFIRFEDEEAVQVATARIATAEQTIVNDREAAARRSDEVAASIGPAVNAKAVEITDAYAAADLVLAGRTQTLEATARPGGNLVPNSSFQTLDGWFLSGNPGGLTSLLRNYPDANWMIGGVENNLTLHRTSAGSGLLAEAASAAFAVQPGAWYQVYALTAAHRARAWVTLFFYDGSGNFIDYAGENYGARMNAGGRDINGHDITGNKCVQAPAGAVQARVGFRLYDVSSDGYAWFHRPFVTEVQEGTDTWARYSAGNDRPIAAAQSARIAVTETAVTDGRFATSQRAGIIEATVDNAVGRISNVETATTDGRFAATGTVNTLRAEYDGTVATVSQQAGAITGLGQKTAAYVRIVADAGGGRAALSLWSDQSGGAWSLTGDGLIDGNLTINGTVNARAFNRASMSREGASVWTGSATPGPGQAVSLPWSLSLGQIPPQGRFIYEFFASVTSNAGTRVQTTHNGKPASINYIGDGGLSVFAIDQQGNTYPARANGSATVLATTDFVPSWTAAVSRGALDTGFIDDGDTYYRNVSATYTVTRVDLRVTWVAI